MNTEELLNVINVLNNIQVPTILIESVALPIRNCAIKLENMYKKETMKKDKTPENKEIEDNNVDVEVYVGDKPPED